MTLIGFLLLIVIGAICGALAEAIVGFHPGGFLASVGIGFVGALLGTYIARALELPALFAVQVDGYAIEIVWAILGAVVFLAVIGLLRRSWAVRRY